MTTVVDSLVLQFNLDTSQFTREQRNAITQLRQFEEASLSTGTAIESQGKRIMDLLSNFRRETVTAIGLLFGGREAGEFINYVTNLEAATGRLGVVLGDSARDISDWQGAFQQIGGTAEGANSALGGLNAEMIRFQLTGQSTMLPILSRLGVSLYDQNRHLKTSAQLWLDLASAVEGMDPRQAAGFLSLIPGASQEMINFALLGRKAMEQHIRDADQAWQLTQRDVVAAQELQRQMGLLERSATGFGAALLTLVNPALTAALNILTRIFAAVNQDKLHGAGDRATGNVSTESDAQRLFESLALFAGFANPGALVGRAIGAAITGGGRGEVESYVRQAAVARGIDPDQAVRVFNAESGLNPGAIGDHGTSFGIAQLHVGGGLGDTFAAKTGKSASDPSSWKSQVDFALDQAAAGGWGPWHAWKGAPFAGIGRGGNSTTNSSAVSVGAVNVYAPNSDADGISKDISAALKRSLAAGSANTGPQ